MKQNILILLFLISTASTSLNAQQLGEMQVEIVSTGISYVPTNPNEAILIVHSKIPVLRFEHNMALYRFDNPDPGEYILHHYPGSGIVTFKADGYMPLKMNIYIDKKDYKEVKVSIKMEPDLIGHGDMRVETDPPACYVVFNGIRLPEKTPLTIQDQIIGNHKIHLNAGFEWDPLDTVVTIIKDSLVTHRFKLYKRKSVNQEALLEESNKETTIIYNDLLKRISEPLPGMEFVRIPAGSFQMGSNKGDSDEKPVHTVHIKSFYMMTTEVTQKQWREVMGNNPSHFRGDNLPVEQVSWNDIQDFLKKLNRMDPGKGYRLPSEAEWEYACCSGSDTRFYFGDDDERLKDYAWYSGNSESKTHPVGTKKANAYGLYDMHGNVWEWCEDTWHDSYKGAPSDGSAWVSGGSTSRVLRGGSWYSRPRYCRSAFRSRNNAGNCHFSVDFRVVCVVFGSP